MYARNVLLAAGAALLLTGTAGAQAQQANPPCQDDIHDDFDFWVGDWNVYLPDGGPYAGQNLISKVNAGCLITEHWEGAQGSVGDSMNYYDPFAQAWRQVWVSGGAIIDYHGGLNDDGAMVLDGEIFYPTNGNRAAFRGTWTLLDDGSVRQHFQQQGADGAWADWFIGIYVRKEDDPRAEEAAAARGE